MNDKKGNYKKKRNKIENNNNIDKFIKTQFYYCFKKRKKNELKMIFYHLKHSSDDQI